MPAVTADTLTLARVPRAALGDVERPVVCVTTAPQATRGRASRCAGPSPASRRASSTRSS